MVASGLVLSTLLAAPLLAQDDRARPASAPSLKAEPLVAYDSNMNGGLPGASFDLAGLRFDVPPERVAQAGTLIGAKLSLAGMTEVGTNFGLSYSASVQALTGLASDVQVRTGAASVCGLTFLSDEILGSACATTSREEKALSLSSTTSFEAAFDRRRPIDRNGKAMPGWETSLSGLVGRDLVDDGWRSKAGGGLGLYGPGGRSATFDATLYQPIANRLSDRYSLELGVKIPDRFPAGIGMSYVRSEGGTFFGLPRQDATYRLSVDLKLGKRILASVGYTRKNSTVDFYDVSGSFDVRLFALEYRP